MSREIHQKFVHNHFYIAPNFFIKESIGSTMFLEILYGIFLRALIDPLISIIRVAIFPIAIFLTVFIIHKYTIRRFIRSDLSGFLRDSYKGLFIFRLHFFYWVCISVFELGEAHTTYDELIRKGVSPDTASYHSFITFLSGLVRAVNFSLMIKKEKENLRRYIIISKRGFFLKRTLSKLLTEVSALKSYLKSSGFLLRPLSKEESQGFLFSSGFFIRQKIVFEKEKMPVKEIKHDITSIMGIKNLLLNRQSEYALILNVKKFPKIRKVLEKDNRTKKEIPTQSYKFGVYTFYYNKEQHQDAIYHASFILSLLGHILSRFSVKKSPGKLKLERSGILQYTSCGPDNIVVKFGIDCIEEAKQDFFGGILSLLLACVEERVAPNLNLSDSFSQGDLFIGYQMVGKKKVMPFYLDIDDLSRHFLIVGPTGAGKTTLTKILIKGLLNKTNRPAIWIFDFHGEYLNLRNKGFFVISPGSRENPLALNIFNPGAEEPEIYFNFLSELLSDIVRGVSEGFSPQMERLITSAVYDTVLSEDARNPLYFLNRVYELSEELSMDVPSAKFSFHAIINRLKIIFSGIAGHVFWVPKTNINMKELLERDVIFDMSYFSSKEPTKKALWILVNVLLRYLYTELVNMDGLFGSPRVFIVIEEARYVAPKKQGENMQHTSAAEDLAILGRKYGISLCFITQSASSISRDIVDNAGTIFMMGDGPREIINDVLSNINAKYLQLMPTGEVLIKMNTKSAIVHVKLKEPEYSQKEEIAYLWIEDLEDRFLRSYQHIPISYETFVQKLISKEIARDNIREIISGGDML